MLSYRPATVREQQIIDSLNKPTTATQKQINYNSEWYMTKEDKIYMVASIIGFIIILMLCL
jgi:hypothetical protein